ncbi:hypothetical protein [Bacillus sp. AFS031507]|uniref:hypothetical protein n=1 Tax=Bacillus sp. AFS031507 TaxID=2033496 RepID=UPI001156A2D3|nr:hypothetical protein [Bacillus sp. AFS031507]
MNQSEMLLFNENDKRRIFLHPHAFYHHFYYGGPHFGAPFWGGFTGGMMGGHHLSPYGYSSPYYGYGYPGYYSYY